MCRWPIYLSSRLASIRLCSAASRFASSSSSLFVSMLSNPAGNGECFNTLNSECYWGNTVQNHQKCNEVSQKHCCHIYIFSPSNGVFTLPESQYILHFHWPRPKLRPTPTPIKLVQYRMGLSVGFGLGEVWTHLHIIIISTEICVDSLSRCRSVWAHHKS